MLDPVGNADAISTIDRVSFWVFMSGLYHQKYIIGVALALLFERQCINWVKNRYGCTYFNLQKFIELDIRRDGLRYNWSNPKYCKYDLENYRKHYFSNDFDYLKARIEDNILEKVNEKDENGNKFTDEYGRIPIGDFVPVRLANRLMRTIQFSCKLDLRCPQIKFDDVTKSNILEAHIEGMDYFSNENLVNGDYDYENIPVLKQHKIESLESIIRNNVDRKYKISFFKGM